MSSGNWFRLVDHSGVLGDYVLQLNGHLYKDGRPEGRVEGDRVIADYSIGHFDKPNEPVERRGTIKDGNLVMDSGQRYKLEPIEAPF